MAEGWSRKPPMASEIVAQIQALIAKHGDLPFILWDADTGWLMIPSVDYFPPNASRPARIEIGGDYSNTTEYGPLTAPPQ